jgi:hypothetical protein
MKKTTKEDNIYIYIYICVCVCVHATCPTHLILNFIVLIIFSKQCKL